MKTLQKIRKNIFLFIVILAYIVLFIFRPKTGLDSIKSSGYFLKEMLLIMPVVFVLTALLEFWVPKKKIMQYLGTGAKLKGIILSFIIGSVSAGPIYAAFPMCVMLYHKGASVRNLVIILSSWAVIKIPMLINEVKFLGFQFMALRWVLTIIAIFIFSWITDKMIDREEIVKTNQAGKSTPKE
ncbi:MAG TPA: permease [Clostridiaceae bacterium]|nr:permease [Clostridiaceae bacterium]